MSELRCGKCNRLIGKNVIAGEFKCPRCGTFIMVQAPTKFVTVDNKPITVV